MITRVTPSHFVGPRKTANYRPAVLGSDWYGRVVHNRPPFDWAQAEDMLADPQVDFALRVLRAPLYRVQFDIQAESRAVGKYLAREVPRIWKRCLRKLLGFLAFGSSAGEATYRVHRGRYVFDRFDDLHPRDCRPLVFRGGNRQGELAGIRVRGGCGQQDQRGQGFDLIAPHAVWCPGEASYGRMWGRPRIKGALAPWLEKTGKRGALDIRAHWFRKCSFRGGVIRHPIGTTDVGDETTGPIIRNNEDLAHEIVEKFETGGVLSLPNIKDENGDYLWTWEPPAAHGEAGGIRDYPKDLDREILIGVGVVPEIVEAATVGSGFSGRAIPAQVFFASEDELAAIILECLDRHVFRWLIAINFGAAAVRSYTIEHQSMVEQIAKQSNDQNAQMLQPGGQPGVSLSINRIRRRLRRIELSWAAAQTRTGGTKAVGTGEHAGQVLYGDDARRALNAGRPVASENGEAQGSASRRPDQVDPAELEAFRAEVPEADRPAWPKIAAAVSKAYAATWNKLTELGMLALDVVPAVMDVADDCNSMRASVYAEHDAWKDMTGVSWSFTMTLTKHALSLAFKAKGLLDRRDKKLSSDSTELAREIFRTAFAEVCESLGIKPDAKLSNATSDLQGQLAAVYDLMLQAAAKVAGGDESAQDELDELANLAAELSDRSVQLAWTEHGQSKSGKPRWKNTETGEVRYQKSKPGEIREKRERSAAKAKELLTAVNKFLAKKGPEVTAQQWAELATHLPAMTVATLRQLRDSIAQNISNQRSHANWVAEIRNVVKARIMSQTRGLTLSEKIERHPLMSAEPQGDLLGHSLKHVPELEPYRDIMRVEGLSDAQSRRNVVELSLLPKQLLDRMRQQFGPRQGLWFSDKSVPETDHAQALKGIRPPGYPEGKTWDDSAGAYFGNGHGRVLMGSKPHGSASVAIHEFGHAIGDMLDLDQSAEMTEFHKKAFDRLVPYLQQGGPGGSGGMKEMFAESLAERIMYGKDYTAGLYGADYIEWLDSKLDLKGVP